MYYNDFSDLRGKILFSIAKMDRDIYELIMLMFFFPCQMFIYIYVFLGIVFKLKASLFM